MDSPAPRFPRLDGGQCHAFERAAEKNKDLIAKVITTDANDNPNNQVDRHLGSDPARRRILVVRPATEAVDTIWPQPRSRAPAAHQGTDALGAATGRRCCQRSARCCHRTLILGEPTRGADVGTKAKIDRLVRQLPDSGIALRMIGSELPEVIGRSERALVMRDGEVRGELVGADVTDEPMASLASRWRIHAWPLTVVFNIVLLLGSPVQFQFVVKGRIILLAMTVYAVERSR